MKIEIELHDLEALRREIATLKAENAEMRKTIRERSNEEIESKAVDLASTMFSAVMKRLFKEIGLEYVRFYSDVDFIKLEHHLGKNWTESDQLQVTVSAMLSNRFRKAFVDMKILPPDNTPCRDQEK